jgi:SpoVK/Ycf46/Vps4 family AAA+-type ATPase
MESAVSFNLRRLLVLVLDFFLANLLCRVCSDFSLLIQASGPELVGGTSGESEERIRQIFDNAKASAPSVLFIDAIDVIAAKKDVSRIRVMVYNFLVLVC